MKQTMKILSLGAFAAMLVFAQGPGRGAGRGPGSGKPPDPQEMLQMRIEMLTRRLTLTDDQKARATTIYTNAQAASSSLRTSLQTTLTSLDTAVKANNVAAIDTLSAAFGNTTGQLTAIDRKADAALYSILTDEQKTKFDSGRMGGPGAGPMGFGGGRRYGRPPQDQ